MLSPQPNINTTSPVVATAVFDPPVIRPGSTTTYRVSFNALMASVEWPEEVIAPDALELAASARGEAFMHSGAGMTPHTGFNYRVRGTTNGSFTVPRFIVYVYGRPVTVPQATLEVTANPAVPVAPGRRLLLSAANTNPFVGQNVAMRIVMPASGGGVQPLNPLKLIGDGFMPDPGIFQQRMDIFPEYGTNSSSLICETGLTPLKPGKIEVTAQGFTAGLNAIGPITIRGSITLASMNAPPALVDSDRLTLNVRPLPRENVPAGFNGAIGQFKLDPPSLAPNVLRVGDPVTLAVTVRGTGTLTRLAPPPPPVAEGWQAFAGADDPTPPQIIQARGFAVFTYTLIPTAEGAQTTPRIPFGYFDPERADYVDLSVPALNVTVQPGATPVDTAALAETNAPAVAGEKEVKLSGIAASPGRTMAGMIPVQRQLWFPLMQLVPGCALVALWTWDRRRRFHEAHPEVMLRRRARRALHREWAGMRKAAALGDTSRFATCAVNAMRVACAPHFPAEPRALVSCDVAQVLDENRSGTGFQPVRWWSRTRGQPPIERGLPPDRLEACPTIQTVCQVFAAADAERFAEQPEPAKDLLALRGEVDRVLTELEARL